MPPPAPPFSPPKALRGPEAGNTMTGPSAASVTRGRPGGTGLPGPSEPLPPPVVNAMLRVGVQWGAASEGLNGPRSFGPTEASEASGTHPPKESPPDGPSPPAAPFPAPASDPPGRSTSMRTPPAAKSGPTPPRSAARGSAEAASASSRSFASGKQKSTTFTHLPASGSDTLQHGRVRLASGRSATSGLSGRAPGGQGGRPDDTVSSFSRARESGPQKA